MDNKTLAPISITSDTENCDVAAHAHALLADEIGFSGPSDSCLHLAAVADMSDNFCRVALQHVCGSAKRGCIGTALANDAVYRPIFDKARAAKLAVGGVAEHGFVMPAKGPSGRTQSRLKRTLGASSAKRSAAAAGGGPGTNLQSKGQKQAGALLRKAGIAPNKRRKTQRVVKAVASVGAPLTRRQAEAERRKVVGQP